MEIYCLVNGVKKLLIEGEGLNKQGRSVWKGRGGGSSVVILPLGYVPRQKEASDTIDRNE